MKDFFCKKTEFSVLDTILLNVCAYEFIFINCFSKEHWAIKCQGNENITNIESSQYKKLLLSFATLRHFFLKYIEMSGGSKAKKREARLRVQTFYFFIILDAKLRYASQYFARIPENGWAKRKINFFSLVFCLSRPKGHNYSRKTKEKKLVFRFAQPFSGILAKYCEA